MPKAFLRGCLSKNISFSQARKNNFVLLRETPQLTAKNIILHEHLNVARVLLASDPFSIIQLWYRWFAVFFVLHRQDVSTAFPLPIQTRKSCRNQIFKFWIYQNVIIEKQSWGFGRRHFDLIQMLASGSVCSELSSSPHPHKYMNGNTWKILCHMTPETCDKFLVITKIGWH